MGLVLQITSILINMLKVCLHINLYKRPKITCKLEKLVTGQRMAINTHRHKIHNQTCIYDESWANSNIPIFRSRVLGHVDTSRTSEQFVEIGLSIANITVV
jgi:hypothetical protein